MNVAATTNASFDKTFGALANPTRRRMLDLAMDNPGMSIKALHSHFPEMSRIAVLKHVRILEGCDLVVSRKTGRTRHLFFNPIPIQRIYDRWTTKYTSFWSQRMADIKERVESLTKRKDESA